MNLFNRRRYGILMLGLLGIGITSILPAEEETDSITSELMKNVKSYQKEIEDIRGKKFKADVTVEMRSREDFIKWNRKTIEDKSDLQAEKTKVKMKDYAWIKLGLIPKGYFADYVDDNKIPDVKYTRADLDLADQTAGKMYDEAAATYDPIDKKVHIHKSITTMTLENVKVALIHELYHALQDQYFDLDMLRKNASVSEDAYTAINFLMEGEATYLMAYYAIKSRLGNRPLPSGTSITQLLSKNFSEKAASQSLEDILNTGRKLKGQQPILRLDPKTESRYLYWLDYAPYLSGAASIGEMLLMSVPVNNDVSATSWAVVDLAWGKPSLSTEQMLHPHKLLVERDNPTPVSQPILPDGWEAAYSNTLGEFGFRVLFETFEFKKQKCLDFSEGWDGDRYTLIANKKDNRLGLHFATIWDSEKDALESFKAYESIVTKKYPGWQAGKIDIKFASATWTSPDKKSVSLMFRDGAKWTAVEDIPAEDMEFWQKTPPKKD